MIYHEVRVSDYPLFDYQPYELVLTSKLVDVVKHERLDLLHVHYAIPHASAAGWPSRSSRPKASAYRSSPPCMARTSPLWAAMRASSR